MIESLQTRPAFYVVGLLIGLIVVGLYAVTNRRIGVMGGVSNFVERADGRIDTIDWRGFFLVGVLGGALIFRLLSGADTVGNGFGWLTRTFDNDIVVASILVAGGVLIGFGTKLAGGCTSGNGLGGCSVGSPGGIVSTVSFLSVAIAASFVIKGLT